MQAFTLALLLATSSYILAVATSLPKGEERVIMMEHLLQELMQSEEGEQEELEDSYTSQRVEDDDSLREPMESNQDEDEEEDSASPVEGSEVLLQEMIQKEQEEETANVEKQLAINRFATKFKSQVNNDGESEMKQDMLVVEIPDTSSKKQGMKNIRMSDLKIGNTELVINTGQGGLSAKIRVKKISFKLSGSWYYKRWYYKDSGKLKASVKGLGLSMDFFLDVDDEGQLEVVPTYCTSTRGTVSITKMTGNFGEWLYKSMHETVRSTVKDQIGPNQLCGIKKAEVTTAANEVLNSLSSQNVVLIKKILASTYGPNCITELQVSAMTGKSKRAKFGSDDVHHIELQLKNKKKLTGDLQGPAKSNKPYLVELNVPLDLKAGSQCIQRSDIRKVRLLAGSKDGWYIESIKTYVSVKSGANQMLTDNPTFRKWLDDKKKRRSYVLNLEDTI